MLKNTKKILVILAIFAGLFYAIEASAGAVEIPWAKEIVDVSISSVGWAWEDPVYAINQIGFSILTTAKLMLQWILVIYIVYIGAMMIMSMGNNEEQLSNSKRQLWYTLVGLMFINIPGTIYEAFHRDVWATVGWRVGQDSFTSANTNSNLFADFFSFGYTMNTQIIWFLEVIIFIAAVFMIMLAGVNILTSRWREEKITEAKNKILYTVLALFFVGIIEAWKHLAFGGNIRDGINIIESISQLALFFAGPVALFFLTLAGYYYITSGGDEERVKKAKSIVINTVLATLILLATYTFLLDLATL